MLKNWYLSFFALERRSADAIVAPITNIVNELKAYSAAKLAEVEAAAVRIEALVAEKAAHEAEAAKALAHSTSIGKLFGF